jgi:hypothetical protein
MATRIDTIPNRPAGKPVLDYEISAGYARVVLDKVSNDGSTLVLTGWAFQINTDGTPVLDPSTMAPIATLDSTRTVELSGVMAGTHTLYDGWCRYSPASQTTLTADNLPEGWTSGHGAPTATAAIGAGYYDLDSGLGYTFQQGCLDLVAQSFADALQGQINTAAKLATLGI